MTTLEFNGLIPKSRRHETESAIGERLDRWLLEKEGRENRKNQT